jgi:hypothetical protein
VREKPQLVTTQEQGSSGEDFVVRADEKLTAFAESPQVLAAFQEKYRFLILRLK